MTSIDQLRVQGMRILAGIYGVSALLLLAASLAIGEIIFGLVGLAVSAPVILFAMSGRAGVGERVMAGAGLPVIAALMLAVSRDSGYILDMHMVFFVYTAAIAILADWRAVATATLVTALHHLTLNFIAPSFVFADGEDILRVLLHAVILLIEAGALVLLCKRIEALLAAISAEREAKELQDQAITQEREHASAVQTSVLSALRDNLSSLAKGRLSVKVKGLPQEYKQIETDFNSAIGSLDSAVGGMIHRFELVASGTVEIRSASDDLSQRTVQQAANLEETSGAIASVTDQVASAADAAAQASSAIQQTNLKADDGSQIVEEAINAMAQIKKSSTEINNIIGVIDSIAFQTNLLALNAGVEAARAGESGKGFAVVASEVRALAQRCTQAAEEVKGLISASGQQVTSGVDLVQRSGEAFAAIAQGVSGLSSSIDLIADATQTQAQTLGQIKTVVSELDTSTQQNAAMAEECNAAAASLSAQAVELNQAISQFETSHKPDHSASNPITRMAA
ncbi:MAG: methyl-accepting chemotaxis protein [Pseudomonadota bacterium]